MNLLLTGIALVGLSGMPGLFIPRRWLVGQYIAVALMTVGAILGMAGTLEWFSGSGPDEFRRSWALPGADFHVRLDGISAFFLFPVLLVSMLGSIYGLDYWKQADRPENGRKLRLFYGLLAAGMALLVIAQNAILFLFGWELMAISAFFLVTTEDREPEVREAGWIYFVATHVCTLLLFAMFALMNVASEPNTFELVPLKAESTSSTTIAWIYLLALGAFGIKAGIMPLHVWLPSSHAIAPSHVSALMSGVIIKMGIYGLVRVLSLLPTPPTWAGVLLLILGTISAVLGVAFAVGQHDLKRLLAYHSIENIGIIVIGLGLAMIGRAINEPAWVALGLAGALLHTWNHALFKSLLFLCAGSVIHAVHTREIDKLGGLVKRMPWTAFGFLMGATAICGLPPLNGFVSEWLIYLGLFGALGLGDEKTFAGAAFVAPFLAMTGALAVACFVKVFGAVFLGAPRTEQAAQAHESPPSMILPLLVLVFCCLTIGLAPGWFAPLLERAIGDWLPGGFPGGVHLTKWASFERISMAGMLLFGLTALVGGWLWIRIRRSSVHRMETWGCGYLAPTARMQYTSSSFAELLVGLFSRALRPKTHLLRPNGLFPTDAAFSSHVNDVVLDEAVLPVAKTLADSCTWFRRFQQGSIQAYLLYILLSLLALLIWHFWDFQVIRTWLGWG